MPRKTIAGLEAEQSRLVDELIARDVKIGALQRSLDEAAQREQERARHVYLSYEPTGDAEVDACIVLVRTLIALPDETARRVASYIHSRFTEQRNDTA